MTSPAEHHSDDLDALRAIIAAQASQIQELSRSNRAYEALIDALRGNRPVWAAFRWVGADV